MTQRHNTQPLPTISASSSSTGMFLAGVQPLRPRSRSGLLHIPPPPIAECFPEAAPRLFDMVVLGALATALAVCWFLITPAGPPPLW